MRNTIEYPITREEIAECLENIKQAIMRKDGQWVDDMRPLLLAKAKEIVLTGTFDPT